MTADDRPLPVPAPLLVLASIVSVQFGGALARTLFDDLGSAGTMLLRVALSGAVVTAVLRPDVRRWSGAAWRAALLLGAAMAAMNLLFYQSLRTVPLGVAVTVEFLGPLLLALVQTRRLVDLAWVVVAGAGVALLGLDTTSGIAVSGLVFAFGAGLFWAAYILASAHLGQVMPGVEGLGPALLTASVLALPFGLPGAVHGVAEHPGVLVGAAGVAVLASIVPYGLELVALRHLSTRVFGVMMSLEPAAAAVAGLLVLGQTLHARQLAALVAISVASLGVTLADRRAAPTAPVD